MKKTWVAVLILVVGAGAASAQPAPGRGDILPSGPPISVAPAQPSGGGAQPGTAAPGSAQAPRVWPGSVSPPPPGMGCNNCWRAHDTRTCWQKLCDWATYRPLYRGCCGHGCGGCGGGGCGGGCGCSWGRIDDGSGNSWTSCCHYRCFPPIYMYFMNPCQEGYGVTPCPNCCIKPVGAHHNQCADGGCGGGVLHRLLPFHKQTACDGVQ